MQKHTILVHSEKLNIENQRGIRWNSAQKLRTNYLIENRLKLSLVSQTWPILRQKIIVE